MELTTDYALELDPDFANFYPAVPYPGTELYKRFGAKVSCRSRTGVGSRYWSYLMSGNGVDSEAVMGAIRRARRKFLLRPRYISRHVGDLIRLGITKPALAWHMTARTFPWQACVGYQRASGQVPEATPIA